MELVELIIRELNGESDREKFDEYCHQFGELNIKIAITKLLRWIEKLVKFGKTNSLKLNPSNPEDEFLIYFFSKQKN